MHFTTGMKSFADSLKPLAYSPMPSAYLLGVDLPRRRRLDPRRSDSCRRISPMPTAVETLGVLALGVALTLLQRRSTPNQQGHVACRYADSLYTPRVAVGVPWTTPRAFVRQRPPWWGVLETLYVDGTDL
jgi:hypothetical protein